jgi:hypothetical protein
MKKVIYIFSKVLFNVFAVFFGLVFVFSILAFAEYNWGLDIQYVEIIKKAGEQHARLSIPFVDVIVEFLLSSWVMVIMWIGLLFYVLYFYFLKEFFKVFILEQSFNSESLKRLKTFFYINLIPLLYALIVSIAQIIRFGKFKFEEDQGIAIVHLFVAFLVYFYIDLIKKGKYLQEENDLTI